jgi:hypothetical protein
MKTNSITINYKNRQFTLDRVNAEGKYFQIGFASDQWGVRIYTLKGGDMRVIVEKSVKRGDTSHTQFHWDCFCTVDDLGLLPYEVNDPTTCKRISKHTKWLVIDPILQEIHTQLREELDTLHSDR